MFSIVLQGILPIWHMEYFGVCNTYTKSVISFFLLIRTTYWLMRVSHYRPPDYCLVEESQMYYRDSHYRPHSKFQIMDYDGTYLQ